MMPFRLNSTWYLLLLWGSTTSMHTRSLPSRSQILAGSLSPNLRATNLLIHQSSLSPMLCFCESMCSGRLSVCPCGLSWISIPLRGSGLDFSSSGEAMISMRQGIAEWSAQGVYVYVTWVGICWIPTCIKTTPGPKVVTPTGSSATALEFFKSQMFKHCGASSKIFLWSAHLVLNTSLQERLGSRRCPKRHYIWHIDVKEKSKNWLAKGSCMHGWTLLQPASACKSWWFAPTQLDSTDHQKSSDALQTDFPKLAKSSSDWARRSDSKGFWNRKSGGQIWNHVLNRHVWTHVSTKGPVSGKLLTLDAFQPSCGKPKAQVDHQCPSSDPSIYINLKKKKNANLILRAPNPDTSWGSSRRPGVVA